VAHFFVYFFTYRDHAGNIAQIPQKIKKNKLSLKWGTRLKIDV